jgi:hypothetical protein
MHKDRSDEVKVCSAPFALECGASGGRKKAMRLLADICGAMVTRDEIFSTGISYPDLKLP